MKKHSAEAVSGKLSVQVSEKTLRAFVSIKLII
jgi:hypothetical protein